MKFYCKLDGLKIAEGLSDYFLKQPSNDWVIGV